MISFGQMFKFFEYIDDNLDQKATKVTKSCDHMGIAFGETKSRDCDKCDC